MPKKILGIIAAAIVGASGTALAQSPVPFSVEVRAEGAFPRGGPFEERFGTGIGFGISTAVQLLPNYALYGAYSRTAFDLDVIDDAGAVGSGISLGLTRAFPIPGTDVAPWVGTGLLIHDLRVDGLETAAGESRLGYEVGGGVAVAVAPRIRITPGIGYRRYEAPFLANPRERISYFTAGVGLNVEF